MMKKRTWFALVAPEELTKGATWRYAVKLNGQLFMVEKATVTGREKIGAESIWRIKNEYFYKMLREKGTEIHRGENIISLREDLTLKSLERTLKINGRDSSYESIEESAGGYLYRIKTGGTIEERRFSTQGPVYPHEYWLIALLAKKGVLTPEKPCSVLSSTGPVKIEYMKDPAPAPGLDEGFCYLAGNDRIYFNKNQEIIRVDDELHGTFEFISGGNYSIKDLPGYDATQVNWIKSNVPLVKPEELTSLAVYINLDQFYESLDYLQTPSERQKFEGTVAKRIEGVVTITRTRGEITGPVKPFPFPVTIEWGPEFNRYLEGHPLVEVNAPEIIAKAKEITKTAANTWEAVLAIARWVRENTVYDLSYTGLSALGTLKEGKGVCGQIALLTTALCRAVKIPTRYVTGHVYAGELNAFAPHAWVEVYADEAGWRAIDPTTREFTFADLTHIGFCDLPHTDRYLSNINLRPGIIKILDYLPKEAGSVAPPPLKMSKLKMAGRELRYEVFFQERKAGAYTARLKTAAGGGFCLLESIAVSIPGADYKTKAKLFMDAEGYVLEYSEAGVWENAKRKRKFLFDGAIKYKCRHGRQKAEGEVTRVFQNEVQVDLYKLAQWGLLAFRLAEGVKEETVKTVTVFVADTQRHNNIKATIRPCQVEYGGGLVDGWFCAISGARYEQVLYLTEGGVLTRAEIPELGVRAVLVE